MRPESGDGSEEKKQKKRSTQLTMNRKLDSRIDDCSQSNFPKISPKFWANAKCSALKFYDLEVLTSPPILFSGENSTKKLTWVRA